METEFQKKSIMLVNTKKRMSPDPAEDQVLNNRDAAYGLNPAVLNAFNDEVVLAKVFGDLNKDVMLAANEGEPDVTEGGDAAISMANCYSPAETLTKARQEKLSRDNFGKITGMDSLNDVAI